MSAEKPPAGSAKQPWETRLREAASQISTQVEDDLRSLVTYVNDQVVPDVRRNGSVALRAAAAEFTRLAQRVDDANHPPPAKPAPNTKPDAKR